MTLKLTSNIQATFDQIAKDIKYLNSLRTDIGNKAALTTTAKDSIVAAINELNKSLGELQTEVDNLSEIDDVTPASDKTYSSAKVQSLLNEVKESIGTLKQSGYPDIGSALKGLKDKVTALEAKQIDLTELIDDASTATDKVWSSQKTNSEIASAKNQLASQLAAAEQKIKNDILGDNAGALNAIKELKDALEGDGSQLARLTAAINNRVRFDETQTLTDEQKRIASNNIGIGDFDTDFLTAYKATRGELG